MELPTDVSYLCQPDRRQLVAASNWQILLVVNPACKGQSEIPLDQGQRTVGGPIFGHHGIISDSDSESRTQASLTEGRKPARRPQPERQQARREAFQVSSTGSNSNKLHSASPRGLGLTELECMSGITAPPPLPREMCVLSRWAGHQCCAAAAERPKPAPAHRSERPNPAPPERPNPTLHPPTGPEQVYRKA